MLKALIFDVDGTLADTEDAHRCAFNAAFLETGLDWYWHSALYARLLDVTGGRERLRHHGRLDDATIDAVHAAKTRHYAALASRVALRPGVLALIAAARAAGIVLAIATTTTPDNIDALLHTPLGPNWRALFAAVCDGATPGARKPAPDVYLAALDALGVHPADCLAIEDSAHGLRAARAAGIPAIVTPTAWTRGQPFDGALAVLPQLGDLAALRAWHELSLEKAA
jgi:HAD superfamily hydrolase (TIGR01509 family)